ncbi:SPOR domain-containing protein [Spirosoma sp. SC4-14]|uniref:HU domain-containing protein n=1 Tax=Spirosoma sp. SC4-14 TaxID=3128900 RepID=UPI0030CB2DA4
MASVNDYLKKLLYQYDCVVVPELGAFLTHYQPASFTETSGLYLPPRKRVAFNEALRLDDGILSNYIMLHEPVTREGAQRHISQFVGELRQQVDYTGRFELDGIGTFTRNEEGRLQFDPSLRHNFFGEAYGMSAISAQLVDRLAKPEPAIEAVPITAVGPVLVREEDTVIEPLRPSRSYWRVAATMLLIGSLGLFSYSSVVQPGQSLQSSLDPSNLFRIPASFFEGMAQVFEADKPAPSPAATPVRVIPASEKPAPQPIQPAVVASPEPIVEKAPETVPVAKPQVVAPVAEAKPARLTPYYTVIAGSFSSKQNALRFRRQLKKAGYTDAYVIIPSQSGQLYKVAAAGSAIREEAVARMTAVGAVAGTEPWIYKH